MTDRRTLYEEYMLALDDRDDAQAVLDRCPWWRPFRRRYLEILLQIEHVRCAALRSVYVKTI